MNVKTITLTGEETAVRFDRNYPYFWARNPGDSDVYMSTKSGIVPDADGVVTVPAGGGACSGDVGQVNTLYFLGTGKVEVSPQDHAECPFFKAGVKGGDSGGGSEYTLPVASVNALGGVKSGGDITVSSEGAVTVNSVGGKTVKADVPADAKFTDTVYTLPTASTDTLGGVKIDGTSITMDENGTISAAGGSSSLEIGGRNYIRNGNFADGLNFWGTNGYGNVELFPELDYTGHEHNLVKIDLAGKTRSTSIYQDIYLPISGLKNQRTAVISFYARRGNNDGKVSELGLHFNSGNSTYFDVPYADNYKSNRYSFSFPTQGLDNYNGPVLGGNESKGGRTTLYLTLYGDDSSKNGIIYISDIQLEFADDGVISDYRPAPEDLKYTLPAATADVLGGVKVDGTTITAAPDGTISASGGGSSSGGYSIIKITFTDEFAGSTYTVTDGTDTKNGTVPENLVASVKVENCNSIYTVSATAIDGTARSVTVAIGQYYGQYDALMTVAPIYGVSWDGTSTVNWTRTDDAAEFTDPVPYVAGASKYGSPFDNLQPWAGMVTSERTGGTMVAIPKFWYKLTQNGKGMSIQITSKKAPGFFVSPAHMDRGDGKGERDVVYIGRYHCGSSNYKSASNQLPKVNITRSTARNAIHSLGSNIWQSDFLMRFTIWLLYLVEFANWDSQKSIGNGTGNGSGVEMMGTTDSLPYHTGTKGTAAASWAVGIQYRNIEDLWANCFDYCDGCYNAANGFNIILNPSNFNDTSGGTSLGIPSFGFPSGFKVKTTVGIPIFIPTVGSGSDNTYSCDQWSFYEQFPSVTAGAGYMYRQYSFGLFCVSGVNETNKDFMAQMGCRLQELP